MAAGKPEILWTKEADRDLGEAILHAEQRSTRAAERLAQDTLTRIGALHRLSEDRTTLFVVRLWHSSRNPAALTLE